MAKFKISKTWLNIFDNMIKTMDTNRCQLDVTPIGININIMDCAHTSLICIKNIIYDYNRIEMDFTYKNINDKPIYLEQLYYTPMSKSLLKNCIDSVQIESNDTTTIITCLNNNGKFVVENTYIDDFVNFKIPNLKIDNRIEVYVPEFLKIIEPYTELDKIQFELKNNELFIKYNDYKINYEHSIGISLNSNDAISTFNTDLLAKIISVLKQIKPEYVTIYLGNDLPMIVEFNINLATIQIIVAPRIECD